MKRKLAVAVATASMLGITVLTSGGQAEAWASCGGSMHAGEPGFYHYGDSIQGRHPNAYQKWYKINAHNGYKTYWLTVQC